MHDKDVAVPRVGQKFWLSKGRNLVVQVQEISPLNDISEVCRKKPHALRSSHQSQEEV
jgi:hypothetical protein